MHTRTENADGETEVALDSEVRAEQIRLLYEHAPGTYLATLGGATIAVFLLWRELPAGRLLSWWLAGAALTAVRFHLLRCYRRAAPTGEALERWGRYSTTGSMIAAGYWGSAAFLLFVPGNALYNAFTVLLVAGMMAGAGFSLSVFLPAFHAFVLPVGAALLVRLLTASGFGRGYEMTMLAFSGLTALFVPLVYFFGRKSEASLVNLLRARWSNRELSVTLTAKVAELESTNRSLAAEIAAHAESERVLRENQQKLRLFELAITTLPSGVVFTDPLQRDNPAVYMNPAFASITGYAAAEVLGRNLRFMNGGDEGSPDLARVRDAMRERRPCTLVVRNYRKNGTPFWNEMSISPLHDESGRIVRFVIIQNDVSARMDMEAALAESEDRFRQFAESVNVAFWIVDAVPGTLAYANHALRRIIGMEEGAARFRQRKIELVHEEDRESVRQAYEVWLQSDAAGGLDIDYRIARTDGAVRWLHDHAVKLQDDRGEASRILGITEDITDRRTGEEELEQTRIFLESIIEHLPIMIFVKDATDFRYLRLNKAGEEMTGLSRQELLGKTDSDFFPPEEARLCLEKDRQVLAAGAVIDIPEEPLSTRHRGRRYLHTKKIPIVDGAGAARYVLGISEDVTERKEASEAIQAMNAALAKKAVDLASSNEELEAFAYSVSHDLRAPLRHINGFIKLLRDHAGEGLDATSQRYLGKIQSASGRMSALIDELLALSRMARMEMRYTRVSLDRLVREVVQEIAPQAAGREVDWEIGPLPHVNGDRILLRQALFNLVDNALKYTALERRARIEIASEQSEDRHVIVYVRDNGVGFDMKYAHKLFGVFQRLHRQEEFPGTGIGLAHVRRIIERHGGRVWAQSTQGEGAAFFVALPQVTEN